MPLAARCRPARQLLALAVCLAVVVTAVGNQVDDNLLDGQRYLAENSQKPGVVTLLSGLQYRVVVSGHGAQHPTLTAFCRVKYNGTLFDGQKFDEGSAEFKVNEVVPGWTEALQLMVEGDVWELFVPANLGYGAKRRSEKIPPNSVLVFHLELREITGGQTPKATDPPLSVPQLTQRNGCVVVDSMQAYLRVVEDPRIVVLTMSAEAGSDEEQQICGMAGYQPRHFLFALTGVRQLAQAFGVSMPTTIVLLPANTTFPDKSVETSKGGRGVLQSKTATPNSVREKIEAAKLWVKQHTLLVRTYEGKAQIAAAEREQEERQQAEKAAKKKHRERTARISELRKQVGDSLLQITRPLNETIRSKEYFTAALADHPKLLLFYYAPEPDMLLDHFALFLEATALLRSSLDNSKYALGFVDVYHADYKALPKESHLRFHEGGGLPAIKHFNNGLSREIGQRTFDFDEEKDAAQLASVMQAALEDVECASITNDRELTAFTASTNVSLVGYFKDWADTNSLAQNFSLTGFFGLPEWFTGVKIGCVRDAAFARKLGLHNASVAVYAKAKQSDGVHYPPQGEGELNLIFTEDISNIDDHADFTRFIDYAASGNEPFIYFGGGLSFPHDGAVQSRIFAGPEFDMQVVFLFPKGYGANDRRAIEVIATHLARTLTGRIAQHVLIPSSQQNEMDFWGITESRVPAVLAYRKTDGRKHLHRGALTKNAVEHFTRSFLAGDAPEYFKSSALVDDSADVMKTVSRNEYETRVKAEDRAVVLSFCIKSIPQCKRFYAWYFEKLAKELDGQVVCAHFDVAMNDMPNDVPDELETIPTVYFFPAGDKNATGAAPRRFSKMNELQLDSETDTSAAGARYRALRHFVDTEMNDADARAGGGEPLRDEL